MSRAFLGRSGQALVESLVSLSVLTAGFIGIVSLLNQSIGLSSAVADNYTATYLAAEGIEIVKSVVDGNVIKTSENLARGGSGPCWDSGFRSLIFTIGVGTDYTATTPQDFKVPLAREFLGFDGTHYAYGLGAPSKFKRVIHVDFHFSDDEMYVTSAVSWKGRGGSRQSVTLEDRFYNWRPDTKAICP